jgi:hypothetical protein
LNKRDAIFGHVLAKCQRDHGLLPANHFPAVIRPCPDVQAHYILAPAQPFHTVVNERGGRWNNACLRITNDAALAEYAVQEALLRAWHRRSEFRPIVTDRPCTARSMGVGLWPAGPLRMLRQQ